MEITEFNRSEETRDKKVQIEIINKETNEVVERYEKYYDEAERFAKHKIWGRKYFKYKIFEVLAE